MQAKYQNLLRMVKLKAYDCWNSSYYVKKQIFIEKFTIFLAINQLCADPLKRNGGDNLRTENSFLRFSWLSGKFNIFQNPLKKSTIVNSSDILKQSVCT